MEGKAAYKRPKWSDPSPDPAQAGASCTGAAHYGYNGLWVNMVYVTLKHVLLYVLVSTGGRGKEPFALGKGFAECSTRQSPLGKIFLGKGSLPSAFYRGTRQNKKQFCRVLGATLGKIFSAVARQLLTVILPRA